MIEQRAAMPAVHFALSFSADSPMADAVSIIRRISVLLDKLQRIAVRSDEDGVSAHFLGAVRGVPIVMTDKNKSGNRRGLWLEMRDRLRQVVGIRSSEEIGRKTGVSGESVRRYLLGREPSARFLSALCVAEGISGSWLLTGCGEMRPSGPAPASLDHLPTDVLLAEVARRLDRVSSPSHALDALISESPERVVPAVKNYYDHNDDVSKRGDGSRQLGGTGATQSPHDPIPAFLTAPANPAK